MEQYPYKYEDDPWPDQDGDPGAVGYSLEPDTNDDEVDPDDYLPAGAPPLHSHGSPPEPRQAPLSQNQLADNVAGHLSGRLLYDPAIHEWHAPNGIAWGICTDVIVEREIEAALKRERNGFTYSYLAGVTKFLRSRLAVKSWEDSRDYLPMANGILNLKTHKLESERGRYFNWQLPHKYTERTECPVIHGWLHQVTQGNADVINLLHAWMYAVLTGRADLQRYIELIGPGGTGKSTFINLCTHLVGEGNTVTTDLRNLEQSRFETAALYGKRLAVITDSSAYGGDVDILKAITGQDLIRRERKNKDPSGFIFRGMLMVASNQPIQSRDYTSGLSRRRIPVRFGYRVTEADKARYPNGIETAMAAEVPALISRLLAMGPGLLDHIRQPGQVIAQFKFRAELETNPLMSWLHETVVTTGDDGSETASSEMYKSYREYCSESGHNPVSTTKFAGLLVDITTSRGIATTAKRSTVQRYFAGLRLRESTDDLKPLLFDHNPA